MAMRCRRFATAFSSARYWALQQQVSTIQHNCSLWTCGSSTVLFNGVRGMAEAAVAPPAGAAAPTAQIRSDRHQRSSRDDFEKGHKRPRTVEPFLLSARECAGSVKSVYQLRDLQFIPRAVLSQNLPEVVAAISEIFHQTKFDQAGEGNAEPGPKIDATDSEGERIDARKIPATVEHVPALLYNFSRVGQSHTGLRTAVVKQNRQLMQQMFEAVSTQQHLYTQPVFVAQVAAAQARLRIHCRTFWKSLHEDMLDSWNASCTATLIHAYGRLYSTHCLREGQAMAMEKLVVSSDASRDSDTSDSSAAKESESEPPAQHLKPEKYFTVQRPEPVVDATLQKLQIAALHKFHESMDAHAISFSILSFSKQGLLKGEELEILQQGFQRTAANMTSRHIAVSLMSLHEAGANAGRATGVVKKLMNSNPQGLLSRMTPVTALQTLRVIQAWGWDVKGARAICLEQVQQRAARFTPNEAAQALALLADLQAPLAEANMPLLQKITEGAKYLTPSGLLQALKGLEWAGQKNVQGGGQDQLDAVSEARAAVQEQLEIRIKPADSA